MGKKVMLSPIIGSLHSESLIKPLIFSCRYNIRKYNRLVIKLKIPLASCLYLNALAEFKVTNFVMIFF